MTPNRRIFLNIIATYGRSLYALVLGLFTARWVLEALGQVDFGVMEPRNTQNTRKGVGEVENSWSLRMELEIVG